MYSGYREEMFLTKPLTSLFCSICHGVMNNAVRCCVNDHHYCHACIRKYKNYYYDNENPPCPQCQTSLLKPPVAARTINSVIQELVVRCDAEECQWTGLLENRDLHLQNCTFLVSCSIEGCRARLKRKTLPEHETDCPVKRRREQLQIQRSRIALLKHATECVLPDCTTFPKCDLAKSLLVHMSECQDRHCHQIACFSSKKLLNHMEKCKKKTCLLCISFRPR